MNVVPKAHYIEPTNADEPDEFNPESFVSFGDTNISKEDLTKTISVTEQKGIVKVPQKLTVSFFMSMEDDRTHNHDGSFVNSEMSSSRFTSSDGHVYLEDSIVLPKTSPMGNQRHYFCSGEPDLRVIDQFAKTLRQQDSVQDDWTTLHNICVDMHNYRPETVREMAHCFGRKWGVCDSKPSSSWRSGQLTEFLHESPYLLLMIQNIKDIGNFIKREIETMEQSIDQSTEIAPPPAVLDMVATYLKICHLYHVIGFNDLNQILMHMVQAPRILMSTLMKIASCLDSFSGPIAKDMLTQITEATLRCLSVSLRQETVIFDFLKARSQFLLELIMIMK